uniref:CARD domain-containing protein n=1 Tax=Macaca mulatta TaxID=9544 RepID=A0A5F8A410_MACMU
LNAKDKQFLQNSKLSLGGEVLDRALSLCYLYTQNKLLYNHSKEISARDTALNKTNKLLEMIIQRGPKTFESFSTSLREGMWVIQKLKMSREEAYWALPSEDRKIGLPSHVFNSSGSNRQLINLKQQGSPEWKSVILVLGLQQTKIYRGRADHEHSVRHQVKEGLLNWKQHFGKPSIFKNLHDLRAAKDNPSILLNMLE